MRRIINKDVFEEMETIAERCLEFKIGKSGDSKEGINNRYKNSSDEEKEYKQVCILKESKDEKEITDLELNCITYCQEKYQDKCDNIDNTSKHHMVKGEDGLYRLYIVYNSDMKRFG